MLDVIYELMFKNKKNIKRNITTSYIVIIVLSVILSSIGYAESVNVLSRKILENNQKTITYIGDLTDNKFREISEYEYDLLMSNSMKKINAVESDNLKRRYINELFNEMKLKSELMNNIMVFFRADNKCIIDNFGLTNLDTAYEQFFSDIFSSKDEWLDSFFSQSGAKLLCFDKGGLKKNYLIYHMPRLIENCLVAVEISYSKLFSSLNVKKGEAEIAILGSEKLQYSTLDEIKENMLPEHFSDRNIINGKEYILNVHESSSWQLQYIQMIPSAIYLNDIRRIRIVFIICYLISLIGLGALSIVFSNGISKSRMKVEQELENEKKYKKRSIVRRVLEGSIKTATSEINGIGLNDGQNYIALLFDFLDSDENGNTVERNMETLLESLSKKFEKYSFHICIINDMIGGLLRIDNYFSGNNATNNTVFFDIIESDVKKAALEIRNALGIEMRCSISAVVDRIENIHHAYEQCVELMDYFYLNDCRNILFYGNMEMQEYNFSIIDRQAIYDMLINNNFQETITIFELQFNQFINHEKTNMVILRTMIIEMCSVLIAVINQTDLYKNLDYRDLSMLMTKMRNPSQVKEGKNVIIDCIIQMKQLNTKENSNIDSICESIKKYIDENYMNCDLNVNMLSERFEMNRSYLAVRFKKQYDISMSNYIIQVRIKKAKEYLKANYKIKDLITNCGFENESVFYRAFKKYEGMTPTQYKAFSRQDSSDE